MHQKIQKALSFLEEVNYAGYFDIMEDIVPAQMRSTFSMYKQIFLQGLTDYTFNQKLVVFAKEVNRLIQRSSSAEGENPSTDQYAFTPIDQLSQEQYEGLQIALQKAFISPEEFKQLVRFTFNENLWTILPNSNLQNIAFDLIAWAESEGKINDLIAGAYKRKPQSPYLKNFVSNLS